MNNAGVKTKNARKKLIVYKEGKFYFTKEAERTFFFILTIIMLTAGILFKLGIFK